MPFALRAFVVGLVALALAGCGGGLRTYPVSGRVVWANDQPATELAGGSVSCELVTEAKTGSRGEIQEDGSFRLTTLRTNDGAPVGEFQFAVAPPVKYDPKSERPLPSVLDPKYQDFSTSGLRFTVEPRSNEVVLKVSKAKGKK